MDALYNWVFHYNPHTKLWAAFQREDFQDYFNGKYDRVIKGKYQKTLEELICGNDGDLEKIQNFIARLK